MRAMKSFTTFAEAVGASWKFHGSLASKFGNGQATFTKINDSEPDRNNDIKPKQLLCSHLIYGTSSEFDPTRDNKARIDRRTARRGMYGLERVAKSHELYEQYPRGQEFAYTVVMSTST